MEENELRPQRREHIELSFAVRSKVSSDAERKRDEAYIAARCSPFAQWTNLVKMCLRWAGVGRPNWANPDAVWHQHADASSSRSDLPPNQRLAPNQRVAWHKDLAWHGDLEAREDAAKRVHIGEAPTPASQSSWHGKWERFQARPAPAG